MAQGSAPTPPDDSSPRSGEAESSSSNGRSDPRFGAPGTMARARRERWLADRCENCGKRQGYVLGLKGLGLRQRGHGRRCIARTTRRTLARPDEGALISETGSTAGAIASARHAPVQSAVDEPFGEPGQREMPLGGCGSLTPEELQRQRLKTLPEGASSDGGLRDVYRESKDEGVPREAHDSLNPEALRQRLKKLLESTNANGLLRDACQHDAPAAQEQPRDETARGEICAQACATSFEDPNASNAIAAPSCTERAGAGPAAGAAPPTLAFEGSEGRPSAGTQMRQKMAERRRRLGEH